MQCPKYLTTVKAKNLRQVTIFRAEDQFAAWPRNCGLWRFSGDELLVGYERRFCAYKEPYQVDHGYNPGDGSRGTFLSRSTDGGATWQERRIDELKDLSWKARSGKIQLPEKPFDFFDPDMALIHVDDVVLISTDRGHTFMPVARLPHAGHEQVMGRPDYLVRPDGACLLFSTVSTTTGVDGRPVVYLSRNGGQSWEFLNYMTEEPRNHMMIMPSGVWLPSGRVISAVRVQMQKHAFSFWANVYASDDGGRTWGFLSRVNDIGCPCHLLLLRDGRVLATYGYRSKPFGIRATVSEDGGKSWGPEIILRDDGKSWDLGYPRTVQLDNGELFTAYYFNDLIDPINVDGGVRYIASTRWSL